MPRTKKHREDTERKIIEIYSSGPVTKLEDALASEKKLKEFIHDKEAIPDSLLCDPSVIKIYTQRLRGARKGEFQNTKYSQVHMSLKEVGKILNMSAVMIAAKEGKNPKKPLLKIDRNDLFLFCLIYQVSPHYLLGVVDRPEQYEIPKENLVKKPNPSTPSPDYPLPIAKPLPYDGTIKSPIYFPPERVIYCSKLILFNLNANQELLEILIQLAQVSLDVQERILLRFCGSVSIMSCPIEEHLSIVKKAEFEDSWLKLFLSQKDRDYFNRCIKILIEAGVKNFDVLDFISKVSICDSKTQKMVQLVLEDDKFYKSTSHLDKMTKPES